MLEKFISDSLIFPYKNYKLAFKIFSLAFASFLLAAWGIQKAPNTFLKGCLLTCMMFILPFLQVNWTAHCLRHHSSANLPFFENPSRILRAMVIPFILRSLFYIFPLIYFYSDVHVFLLYGIALPENMETIGFISFVYITLSILLEFLIDVTIFGKLSGKFTFEIVRRCLSLVWAWVGGAMVIILWIYVFWKVTSMWIFMPFLNLFPQEMWPWYVYIGVAGLLYFPLAFCIPTFSTRFFRILVVERHHSLPTTD